MVFFLCALFFIGPLFSTSEKVTSALLIGNRIGSGKEENKLEEREKKKVFLKFQFEQCVYGNE